MCIEADGACADPGQLVHVRMGGTDTGECTSAAPCRTLSYALQKVTVARDVIRVTNTVLSTPAATISIDRRVTIDGSDTTLAKPTNVPLFAIGTSAGVVVLEGFALAGSPDPSDPTITVASGSALRIARSALDSAPIDVVNGSLQLRDSRMSSTLVTLEAVRCTNGTVSAHKTEFTHTTIGATNCQLNVSRSRFDEIADGSIVAQGGVALIENNLVISANELADLMSLTNLAPGSTVRFNTFVNTSGVSSDGVALFCDGAVAVTSNIFAYGSAHPLGTPGITPCPTRFSLFDSVAVSQHTAGEGNQVGDAATFFVNRIARDFHLASGSPARQAAESGLPVSEDFEGNRRPAPTGSRPDIGCFEAP
ncbi:MAG TPA: choice-of-anchor Q domain-containing protein [Kofleriaceae bacterium]|nr:choice-of-anchor Q domain-containing protein [Kofleriaceae bacterium]